MSDINLDMQFEEELRRLRDRLRRLMHLKERSKFLFPAERQLCEKMIVLTMNQIDKTTAMALLCLRSL